MKPVLTAATAETHRLVLLHYDRDFIQLSRVTGQSTQWLAKRSQIN
jgi:predicted nucleic acid-binding protein